MELKKFLITPFEAVTLSAHIKFEDFLMSLHVADMARRCSSPNVRSNKELLRSSELCAVYTAGKVQGIRQERERKTKGTVQKRTG